VVLRVQGSDYTYRRSKVSGDSLKQAGKTIRAVAATGNLSTGFREESLIRAVNEGADFVGCDAGSTDSGPYYLGSGNPRGPRQGVKRNLGLILRETLRAGIPAIIGTAGHAGGRPHLEWTVDIVRELAREKDWHFTFASIDSEIEPAILADAFRRDEIKPLSPAPLFNEEIIRQSQRFVAMMGIEPIQAALAGGAKLGNRWPMQRCRDLRGAAGAKGYSEACGISCRQDLGMWSGKRGSAFVSRLPGC